MRIAPNIVHSYFSSDSASHVRSDQFDPPEPLTLHKPQRNAKTCQIYPITTLRGKSFENFQLDKYIFNKIFDRIYLIKYIFN